MESSTVALVNKWAKVGPLSCRSNCESTFHFLSLDFLPLPSLEEASGAEQGADVGGNSELDTNECTTSRCLSRVVNTFASDFESTPTPEPYSSPRASSSLGGKGKRSKAEKRKVDSHLDLQASRRTLASHWQALVCCFPSPLLHNDWRFQCVSDTPFQSSSLSQPGYQPLARVYLLRD